MKLHRPHFIKRIPELNALTSKGIAQADAARKMPDIAPGSSICALRRYRDRVQALRNLKTENLNATKFDLNDAKEKTELGAPKNLNELFPNLGEDMQAIFGCEDQELRVVHTKLWPGEGTEIGVKFRNYFGPNIWVLNYNYRNPNRAKFFLNEVIQVQHEHAWGSQAALYKPDYLVRDNIGSDSGNGFFEKYPLKHKATMNPDQFNEFMAGTVNGRSSSRILADYGLRAKSAVVLRCGSLPSVVLRTE